MLNLKVLKFLAKSNMVSKQTKSLRLMTLSISVIAHGLCIFLINTQLAPIPLIKNDSDGSDLFLKIDLLDQQERREPIDVSKTASGLNRSKLVETNQASYPQMDASSSFNKSNSSVKGSASYPHTEVGVESVSNFQIKVPPQPYYFRPSELEQRPRVISDTANSISLISTDEKLQTATLRLQINENGNVDQVLIDQSEFSEAQEYLIVDTFSKMKFTPGKIDGVPVKSEIKISVASEVTEPKLDLK